MSLPTVLPVLETDDFIVGPLKDLHGRFCLVGWKEKLIDRVVPTGENSSDYISLLEKCCRDEGTPYIMGWSTRNTLRNRQHAARIWADFIGCLGFVEDGPEMDLEA